MDQLFSMIENLGFPIVLSIYLLFRFEKKIDKLDDTITLDVLEDINKDTNSIKNIQINQEGKITYYTNGAAEDPITWSE